VVNFRLPQQRAWCARTGGPTIASCLLGLMLWVAIHTQPAAADSTGLPFLRLGSNARTSALGEAGTALQDDQAFSTNPAALTLSAARVFGITHSEWIQQIRHEYVNAAWKRPHSVIGVAVLVSHVDELERRVQPSVEPLGTFGVSEWAAQLTANRELTPRLRGGTTLRFLRQSIFTDNAAGAAVDVGVLYQAAPSWLLGAAMSNLGTLSKLDREGTDLPLQIKVGNVVTHSAWLLAADAQWARGSGESIHLGLEWLPNPGFALRTGYQTSDTRRLSFGTGVSSGSWYLDYTFIPFRDDLGEAHRLSLHHRG